jgi:hypothetical protein
LRRQNDAGLHEKIKTSRVSINEYEFLLLVVLHSLFNNSKSSRKAGKQVKASKKMIMVKMLAANEANPH